jgi:hypothetical protein
MFELKKLLVPKNHASSNHGLNKSPYFMKPKFSFFLLNALKSICLLDGIGISMHLKQERNFGFMKDGDLLWPLEEA